MHLEYLMQCETSASERAYRFSVRPLAVFFVVGAMVIVLAAAVAPDETIFLPPFEGAMKRVVLVLCALFAAAVGVGLCRRRRIAWYAMFAYIVLGTPWAAWALATTEPSPPTALVVGLALMNLAIAVGLYFATRPAFRSRKPSTGRAP